MKRIIPVVLLGFVILSVIPPVAFAKENKLPLTATASSVYYNSSYYGADKAIDGEVNTYWIGDRNAAPWWIMFDAGDVEHVDNIKVDWYNSSYYAPTAYDIQISDDAVNWTNLYTGLTASDGKDFTLDEDARYIRLYIYSAQYFTLLREFEAYERIDVPRILRFQGNLGNADGEVLEGDYTLTFRLYNTETGGAALWEEVQNNIDIADGILDVELGSVTPIELSFEEQYWLGVEVEGDGEMSPRYKLTSVPYALISEE